MRDDSVSLTRRNQVLSGSGVGSGSFLTSLPSTPKTTFTPADFLSQCRARLGLTPAPLLPLCDSDCLCGVRLSSGARLVEHMLLCPKIRPSAVQARGFAMERCLSNLARDAGFDVKYTERDVAKPNQLTDITILDYPVGNNYKERKESLGKLAKKRAQRAKNKAGRRQPAEERPPPLTNSHLRIDAVVTWGQS